MRYAPAKYFPRVNSYVSGLRQKGAVFTACLCMMEKGQQRKGHGAIMLEELLKEIGKRDFKTVETFARTDSENNPSGPLAFYLRHGFENLR